MFDSFKSIMETQFIKDVKKGGVGGIVTASLEGIERERLKSEINLLEGKYKGGESLENILIEYDEFSKGFSYVDTVSQIKKRLIKKILNIDKLNGTESSNNVNIFKMYFPDFVYVLQLTNGKYYVGLNSESEQFDFNNLNEPNEFINKYKPIRIISQVKKESKYDELNTVLEFMGLYGISNVRGGPYQQINMTEEEIISLINILMFHNGLCMSNDKTIDNTNIITFLMHEYGKFTVEEISNIRNLTDVTILSHLSKCKKVNILIMKQKI